MAETLDFLRHRRLRWERATLVAIGDGIGGGESPRVGGIGGGGGGCMQKA